MFLKDAQGQTWFWESQGGKLHRFLMLSVDGVWVGDGKQQMLIPTTGADELGSLRRELDALNGIERRAE